jgi:hypothetical protein
MPISFNGLDLSFLKTKESQEALRLAHEKAKEDHTQPFQGQRSHLSSPHVMGDIRPFVSPVGEMPEVISSRSTLREHERKHGVYQCGDIPRGSIIEKNEAQKAALIEQQGSMVGEWA